VVDEIEKVNILIVDDDENNLMALSSMLSDLKENVIEANSGKKALRHVLDNEFAVILLDVRMPIMDGFETAEMIRSRGSLKVAPIIFLTAYEKDDESIKKGYTLGAVDYIYKPVNETILKSKVSVFIELFKSRQKIILIEEQKRKEKEKQLMEANQYISDLVRILNGKGEKKDLGKIEREIINSEYHEITLDAQFGETTKIWEREYRDVLYNYLKITSTTYKNTKNKMKDIADMLGKIKASSDDIVRLHVNALRRIAKEESLDPMVVNSHEVKLCLLEMMALMTEYYRKADSASIF
jgi:CheY-like chemotaxis protein